MLCEAWLCFIIRCAALICLALLDYALARLYAAMRCKALLDQHSAAPRSTAQRCATQRGTRAHEGGGKSGTDVRLLIWFLNGQDANEERILMH